MDRRQTNDIKAVVFDFGGVIEFNANGHILPKIAELASVPFSKFKDAYFKHNHLANVENVPWEDVAVRVVQKFDSRPETEAKVRHAVQEYISGSFINKELVNLFPSLRASGFKVAILSNSGVNLRQRLEKQGIVPLVDEIVISGEIGYQKPHKEAFQVLFDRLHLLPTQVVFIDDAEKSLEKAAEIGYTPLLFTSNEKLMSDLRSLSVLK